jgi:hypothetical protein
MKNSDLRGFFQMSSNIEKKGNLNGKSFKHFHGIHSFLIFSFQFFLEEIVPKASFLKWVFLVFQILIVLWQLT